MPEWSLAKLLEGMHNDIQQRLSTARTVLAHPGTKGDASEKIWLELLQKYLPQRYQADSAHVVDSKGKFSDQIDVVIFDRQYSPFIFDFEGKKIVPAESVYAVFEAKQTIDAGLVKYAQEKVASVRALHRTSLPIPHAGGTYPAKPPIHVLGGILTFESEWKPALGESLLKALNASDETSRLNLGCVAAHGIFSYQDATKSYDFIPENRPATSLLFELISRLQNSATVPMIDIKAYAAWLAPEIDLK
ncbi:MAG: hypothetical protein J0H83_09065 [Candidatus Melainabacteria bacterium]|nr:hypothetical protein [Candidatus Melainabacteria bacterium]